MEMTPTVRQFVLHWGEMGTRWGVNRTVAQIHALLYLSPTALCADDLVDTLKVARSNVSNSLRELMTLGLVNRTHELGDRRDHYSAVSDIWEVFAIITEERKRREIDPTLEMLAQCAEEMESDEATRGVTKRRIQEMYRFLRSMSTWYSDIARLPKPVLKKIVSIGAGITRLLPDGRKVRGK